MGWLEHWRLDRDPFDPRSGPFVATPGHSAALARVVEAIEAGDRSVRIRGASGLGKSTVLSRAIEATRGPGRRIARVDGPADAPGLFGGLARALGAKVAVDPTPQAAWRALADGVRLCRWQKLQVVLAVDIPSGPAWGGDPDATGRLRAIDPDPTARLTVIQVEGDDLAAEPDPGRWDSAVRLDRLTRSEAADYLAAKLGAGGRDGPAFEPAAIARLHALAEGAPRWLDRIAGLALRLASDLGLDRVPPALVEGSADDADSGRVGRRGLADRRADEPE